MRSYYHCSTGKYRRRKAVLIVIIGCVCAETAVTAFIVAFFDLSGSGTAGLAAAMLLTAAAFVSAGLVLCFAAAARCDKLSSRHSRYTFLDIQQKAAVVSVYSGEMRILGKNAIFRELYLIPFGDLISVSPSPGGKKFAVTGKIRRYGMESDFLGYHVRGGNIEFDRWWLNAGSFEETDEASFPAFFGSAEKICAALTEAKKRYDEIPKPQKHIFREADHIRRRPVRRVLPDDPDFSRTWK